jgi:hypothetical protein
MPSKLGIYMTVIPMPSKLGIYNGRHPRPRA